MGVTVTRNEEKEMTTAAFKTETSATIAVSLDTFLESVQSQGRSNQRIVSIVVGEDTFRGIVQKEADIVGCTAVILPFLHLHLDILQLQQLLAATHLIHLTIHRTTRTTVTTLPRVTTDHLLSLETPAVTGALLVVVQDTFQKSVLKLIFTFVVTIVVKRDISQRSALRQPLSVIIAVEKAILAKSARRVHKYAMSALRVITCPKIARKSLLRCATTVERRATLAEAAHTPEIST